MKTLINQGQQRAVHDLLSYNIDFNCTSSGGGVVHLKSSQILAKPLDNKRLIVKSKHTYKALELLLNSDPVTLYNLDVNVVSNNQLFSYKHYYEKGEYIGSKIQVTKFIFKNEWTVITFNTEIIMSIFNGYV